MRLDNMFLIQDNENVFVDIINLKIFALLMCRGSSKDKAAILFDLILGPQSTSVGPNSSNNSDKIAWKNPRLV